MKHGVYDAARFEDIQNLVSGSARVECDELLGA
jgi:hypothetical protein